MRFAVATNTGPATARGIWERFELRHCPEVAPGDLGGRPHDVRGAGEAQLRCFAVSPFVSRSVAL
jgi:hypothetical protein